MELVLDVETRNTKAVIEGRKRKFLDPFVDNNYLVSVGFKRVSEGSCETFWFEHDEFIPEKGEVAKNHAKVQEALDACTLLIGHNIGFDLQWLWACGFSYDGPVFDTMIAQYILDRSSKEPLSLGLVAERRDLASRKQDTLSEYFKKGYNTNEVPADVLDEYLQYDLLTTEELYLEQVSDYEKPENASLQRVLDVTNKTTPVLARMYKAGVKVDMDVLQEVEEQFVTERNTIITELNSQIRDLMGDTKINLNSPEQKSWVIYSRKPMNKDMWANIENVKYMKPDQWKRTIRGNMITVTKTKAEQCGECKGSGKTYRIKKDGTPYKKPNICKSCNGEGYIYKPTREMAGLGFTPPNAKWHSANGFSTSGDNLEYLEGVARSRNMDDAVKFLANIRRLNAVENYISTFVNGIKDFTKSDGLLHVSLTQTVTATGRFSGRDPNMQNMPRGGTFPIKKVFVSRWEGGKIMEADFAQLEFRVAGYLSQDPTVIEEVVGGFDVHQYTADVITKAGQKTSRQEAKAHTFAPLYGATGYGRTPAEAAYYEHFTEKYDGIARWHSDLATEALTYGKITTPSGRQFSFPNVKRKKNGTVTRFTEIKNYPVQSLATADIVPAVLCEIDNNLRGMKSMIVNSVHDSLVIDIHPDEVVAVVKMIHDMNSGLNDMIKKELDLDMNVPLLLEAKLGDNWLNQKDVKYIPTEDSIEYD